MNPVTQFLNMMLVLSSSFVDHKQVIKLQDDAYKFLAGLPSFPLKLLMDNGGACNTFPFKMGDGGVKMSMLPRGHCANCCQIDLSRDVRFVLYGGRERSTSGRPIEPYASSGAAKTAGVDPSLPTVLFIQGFTEKSPGDSGQAIVDAYMSLPTPPNIILMDWSDLCAFPWYRQAVGNVKWAGAALRRFLQTHHDSGEIPIDGVHLIGFSLGSHIASHAGKTLRKGVRVPRITALDPAYPEYDVGDTSRRLTQFDATYVDVIHTDSGVLGFPIPLGHADYYPNGGGPEQPGCHPSYLMQTQVIDQVLACSHVRAWKLYTESVRNPGSFPASRCRNWRGPDRECNFTLDAYLGYPVNNFTKGRFYLMTKPDSPYSMTVEEQTG